MNPEPKPGFLGAFHPSCAAEVPREARGPKGGPKGRVGGPTLGCGACVNNGFFLQPTSTEPDPIEGTAVNFYSKYIEDKDHSELVAQDMQDAKASKEPAMSSI
jgi:hypothetical protein